MKKTEISAVAMRRRKTKCQKKKEQEKTCILYYYFNSSRRNKRSTVVKILSVLAVDESRTSMQQYWCFEKSSRGRYEKKGYGGK